MRVKAALQALAIALLSIQACGTDGDGDGDGAKGGDAGAGAAGTRSGGSGGKGSGAGAGGANGGASGRPTAGGEGGELGGAGPDGEAGAGTGGSTSPTDLSWIYDTPYDPIDVSLTLDAANEATRVIGANGGTLIATGADGTTYRLDVPRDALAYDTDITLTPVESVSGLPFGDGSALAVQLSPEGLSFNDFATLTITPAEPIAADERLPFGYRADGGAVSVPLVDPASGAIEIALLHFSGAGVAKGLLSDIDPVRRRLGGDIEARFESAVALAIREAQRDGTSDAVLAATIGAYYDEYHARVVAPRIAAAAESCAAARLAMLTVLSATRMCTLLGLGGRCADLPEPAELFPTNATVCLKEEYELCRDDHVVHRIANVWRGFLRQAQLFGKESELAGDFPYVERCLRFELRLDSTALLDASGSTWESRVTSRVPLRVDPADTLLVVVKGDAPLVNESYAVTVPMCTTSPVRGGGTFEVTELELLVASSNPEVALGELGDVALHYVPGMTSESYTMSCQGIPVPAAPVIWTELFVVTHDAERGPDGFVMESWDVIGDDFVAEKVWELTAPQQGGSVTENGSFELYHQPG